MYLKESEIDFFKELAMIGSGNAATSLSKILNRSIHLSVPEISLLDYSEIFLKLGNPGNKVVAMLANVSEPAGGLMLLILDVESANYIFDILNLEKIKDDDVALNKMEESALTEVSNILFNSYLNALSQLTNETIVSDKPFYLLDMLGAILNYPINTMPDDIDKIMLMDSEFKVDNRKIDATLLLLTGFNKLKKFMKVFGIQNE